MNGLKKEVSKGWSVPISEDNRKKIRAGYSTILLRWESVNDEFLYAKGGESANGK